MPFHSRNLKKIYTCFVLSFACFYIFGCSSTETVTKIAEPLPNLTTLKDKLAYIISDPNLFNAQIGLYVESVESGDILFHQNEHKLFISASNMKIFTTAAALLRFGPRFTYKTNIYHSNSFEGDLYAHIK